MAPINFNGQEIDTITFTNGTKIDSVEVNGQKVFSSTASPRIDDFSSNTLDEYTPRLSYSRSSNWPNWQITSGQLEAPDNDNSDVFLSYDISNEYATTNFVDASIDITSIPDNDAVAIALSDNGQNNVYAVFVTDDYNSGAEGLAEWNWGSDSLSGIDSWSKSLSSTNNLRITYDGTTLNGFYNNSSTPEVSATVNFTPTLAGPASIGMDPPPKFDNFTLIYE